MEDPTSDQDCDKPCHGDQPCGSSGGHIVCHSRPAAAAAVCHSNLNVCHSRTGKGAGRACVSRRRANLARQSPRAAWHQTCTVLGRPLIAGDGPRTWDARVVGSGPSAPNSKSDEEDAAAAPPAQAAAAAAAVGTSPRGPRAPAVSYSRDSGCSWPPVTAPARPSARPGRENRHVGSCNLFERMLRRLTFCFA